jgi:hypothetical protein
MAVANMNWLAQPYTERYILAGFLNADEASLVYASASQWPDHIREEIRARYGAGTSLPPRPDAGICEISIVEESDALSVLHPVARVISAPAIASFSYSWVTIQNLIATSAIADPLPQTVAPFDETPSFLAKYSLYRDIGRPIFISETSFATIGPINIQPAQAAITEGQLVVRYKLSNVIAPIIVGWEQDYCYLLKGYGRVLKAMTQGVKRLLCLVYYGLDLTKPDMNVRGLNTQGLFNIGEPVNHFGPERLKGMTRPLVRDFLDSALAVNFPSRADIFIHDPSVQSLGIQFNDIGLNSLPLTGGLVTSSMGTEGT